jgi:hypothetical protein
MEIILSTVAVQRCKVLPQKGARGHMQRGKIKEACFQRRTSISVCDLFVITCVLFSLCCLLCLG